MQQLHTICKRKSPSMFKIWSFPLGKFVYTGRKKNNIIVNLRHSSIRSESKIKMFFNKFYKKSLHLFIISDAPSKNPSHNHSPLAIYASQQTGFTCIITSFFREKLRWQHNTVQRIRGVRRETRKSERVTWRNMNHFTRRPCAFSTATRHYGGLRSDSFHSAILFRITFFLSSTHSVSNCD